MAFNQKDWYARNQARQRALARARSSRYRGLLLRLRKLVLSSQPCMDCHEPPDPSNPFEFDHRIGIGSRAQRRMSNLITKGSSAARFMRELEHCDVVCPTCHKRRTYDRGQWRRSV